MNAAVAAAPLRGGFTHSSGICVSDDLLVPVSQALCTMPSAAVAQARLCARAVGWLRQISLCRCWTSRSDKPLVFFSLHDQRSVLARNAYAGGRWARRQGSGALSQPRQQRQTACLYWVKPTRCR